MANTHMQTVFVLRDSGYRMVKVEVPSTEPVKKAIMPTKWTRIVDKILFWMLK